MSKKMKRAKHKKNNNYKRKKSYSCENPNAVGYNFHFLRDDVFTDYLINHVDSLFELKETPFGVVPIPGAEIELPITGHWFMVTVYQDGLIGRNVLTEFCEHLSRELNARVFRTACEKVQMFFAVDAPIEKVYAIWAEISIASGYGPKMR